MSESPDPWPQFETSRLADEYMPSSADVLAEIRAHEKAMREQHGDRITRITLSPALAAWFTGLFPDSEPALASPWGSPWATLSGIPIVKDASFVNGHLRIHRGGDVTEDYIAVPPDNPKWLVRIEEPVFPFPWSPR